MKKMCKYGLVVGLTMAAFAFAPISETHATTGFSCGSDITAETGTVLTIGKSATSCIVGASFATAPADEDALTISGLDATDYSLALSGEDVSLTINSAGIAKIAATGNTGVAFSISDGVETFQTTLKVEQATLSSINATVTKSEILPGETSQITVTPDVAGSYTYTYSTEQTGAITISDAGLITAIDGGPLYEDIPVAVTVGVSGHSGITKTVNLTIKANAERPKILSGDAQTYKKGSSEGLTIRIDAPVENVIDIAIWKGDWRDPDYKSYDVTEGGLVEGRDYILKSGSTILTFTPKLLDKLSNGTWSWVVVFSDGAGITETSGTFKIANGATITTASATSKNSALKSKLAPKTGAGVAASEQGGAMNAALAVIASFAITVAAFLRKKVTRK